MSSVSGSDSSSGSSNTRSNDEIRRQREEYQKNESDMVKRHQHEVRRLNETHEAETQALQAEHDRQLSEMQKHSHDTLTERDQKHQDDIEGIRAIHRKQAQATAEDTQHREGELRESLTKELDTQKKNDDARINFLKRTNTQNSDESTERYESGLKENREEQARGLNDQRQRLEKVHKDDLDSVRDQRDAKIAQLQTEYDGYRRDAASRIKGNEVKHMQDSQRQSDSMVRAIQNERAQNAAEEKKWRAENGEGVQDVREHYEGELEKNRQALENARKTMEGDYDGHVLPEMSRLRDQNEMLRNESDRDERLTALKNKREMSHFRDAYTKNIENYKMQREEAVRSGNDRRRKDIENLTTRDDKMITENNRANMEKMADQSNRLHSEYLNMNTDFKGREDEIQVLSDARVANVTDDAETEKQRAFRHEQESHDTMERTKSAELKSARQTNDKDKADAIGRIKDQARQFELNQTEKLAAAQARYRHEVSELHDQLTREKKGSTENAHHLVEDLEHQHKLEMDQQMAKYEDRIRALQNQQQEEIRRLNRNSEERLSQVAATSAHNKT